MPKANCPGPLWGLGSPLTRAGPPASQSTGALRLQELTLPVARCPVVLNSSELRAASLPGCPVHGVSLGVALFTRWHSGPWVTCAPRDKCNWCEE